MPNNILSKIPENREEIRQIFLNPEKTSNYKLQYGELNEKRLYEFLCDQRDFSRRNIETVVQRMKDFYRNKKGIRLEKWF